jgi:hypothetical protein
MVDGEVCCKKGGEPGTKVLMEKIEAKSLLSITRTVVDDGDGFRDSSITYREVKRVKMHRGIACMGEAT